MKNRKRIVIALFAIIGLLGIGLFAAASTASAAPVQGVAVSAPQAPPVTLADFQSGNGTANFYLKGHCGINMPLGTWAALDFTNYDNLANQKYHTAITRSGVGIVIDGVYIDGRYVGKGLDMIVAVSGHGRHTVKLKVHPFTSGTAFSSCQTTV